MNSNRWLRERYCTFNRLYFRGRLPLDTLVMWTHRLPTNVSARTYYTEPIMISINCALEPWTDFVEMDLLHEMCHLATKGNRHGRLWQGEMLRLAKIGAFASRW